MQNSCVSLKQLVCRYKTDVKMLEQYRADPERRALLERRIEKHKNDIAQYVTSDSFAVALNTYRF